MTDRIPRRDFNKKAALTLATSFLLNACSSFAPDKTSEGQKPAPELIVPINEEVFIVDVGKDLLTADVGINRLFIFATKNPDYYFIFTEFSDNAEGVPVGLRRQDPDLKNNSGFVPFDPEFNPEKALEIRIKVKSTEANTPQPLISYVEAYQRIFKNATRAGSFLSGPVTLNTNLMLVFGPGYTLLHKEVAGQTHPQLAF